MGGMATCSCRLFTSFAPVMISIVAHSVCGVAEPLTVTTRRNERAMLPRTTEKAKSALPKQSSRVTLSLSSASATTAQPTLTSLLRPPASPFSANASDATRAALASVVSATTNGQHNSTTAATTVEAAVASTRLNSIIPARAPAIGEGAAIAVKPSSIAQQQVTSPTLSVDLTASPLAEKPSMPPSKSKPLPPPPLLKGGENCSSSAQCKDGCCRRADGTLVDVFGHDGSQAEDVIVPMHGVCSKKLGEVSEYCGSGCKCNGGLSCYKPRIGVCCQPELCYAQSFVNHQQSYLKRCQSRRGCVMPPQFDD